MCHVFQALSDHLSCGCQLFYLHATGPKDKEMLACETTDQVEA